MLARKRDQGDTLIEVMLAIAIFTLAAVSTITILNQGVAISQRSLEKSLVRQQIDSQAEAIRYIRSTDEELWRQIIAPENLTSNPMPLSIDACPVLSSLNDRESFFIAKDGTGKLALNGISSGKTNYDKAAVYAKIDYSTTPAVAHGFWVEVAKSENASTPDPGTGARAPDAYDFYIHACWDSIGTNVPMTAGTIVRVYGE